MDARPSPSWVKTATAASPGSSSRTASKDVNFIVHRGDTKDGTEADRTFNPSRDGPEIWLKQDDGDFYTSQAAAQGFVTIHYQRPDGTYDGWGLHLWGDAIADGVGTEWGSPRPYDGVDDFGAYWNVPIKNANAAGQLHHPQGRRQGSRPGPELDPGRRPHASGSSPPTRPSTPQQWLTPRASGIFHYHRPAGDYGDYTSNDFNDFWGLHTWNAAAGSGLDHAAQAGRRGHLWRHTSRCR